MVLNLLARQWPAKLAQPASSGGRWFPKRTPAYPSILLDEVIVFQEIVQQLGVVNALFFELRAELVALDGGPHLRVVHQEQPD
jgi:hypothetical protein